MAATTIRFAPRARAWDSLALLGGLNRHDIALSDTELAPHRDLMEYDMVTEFDAQNFDAYLTTLAGDGVVFTPEFMAFRAAWKWDEWNHYIGYRRLVHMLSGVPEAELHGRTSARACDFGAMAHLLADEFSICMVFAYDEIVTRESCAIDFELFRSFGHPNFLTWIKRVCRDEGWHFSNVVDVLRARHRHRLGECDALLDRLLAWDLERAPYAATFVLDHDPERFDEPALRRCATTLVRSLRAGG